MYEEVEVNSERWLSLENLKNEEWRDIIGYENLYQISNYGRIKSLKYKICKYTQKSERIIKERIIKKYYYVDLHKNCKVKSCRINRLVAIHFISNPNNLPCVNHIDENKLNNMAYNLEWCTYSKNMLHNNLSKRIAIKKSKPIIQCDLEGNFVKRWNGMSEASRVLNYDRRSIFRCCNGKRKKAYGYKWKYENDKN